MVEEVACEKIPRLESFDSHDIGSLLFCRTYPQFLKMADIILSKKCPFCHLDPEVNKVLSETKLWRVWDNPYPHTHQLHHIMVVPKPHLTHLHHLTPHILENLGEALEWICLKYDLTGGGISMRFGNPEYNAGTVRHLHLNIQVPDLTGGVKITLSKTPEKMDENRQRMWVFEELRQGGRLEELSEKERGLVEGRLE